MLSPRPELTTEGIRWFCQQARLAQSVEHETLNLRVVGSSPTLGALPFACQGATLLTPPLVDCSTWNQEAVTASVLREGLRRQPLPGAEIAGWRRGLVG